MPKILINEVDNTSAGTPGRYGNYAVLLPGFKGTPSIDEKKLQNPDENGVYEFNSAQAFKDTIGLTEATAEHAGNRMAYELLNLGYPVIYKVIEDVTELADEGFWSDFKDKASYDFRFVSHGLLASNTDAAYAVLLDKRDAMEADLALLKEIETEAGIKENHEQFTVDEVKACDDIFAAKTAKGNYGSFASEEVYSAKYSYYHTAAGLSETEGGKKDPEAGVAGDLADIIASIEFEDSKSFTVGVYNKINGNIAKLASYRVNEDDGTAYCDGRGDCIALIELDEKSYVDTGSSDRPESLIINGIKRLSSSIGEEGAYCALTVPSVHYIIGNSTEKFPAAFHYLACFMGSLSSGFAEWYAAAGYNRGVSSYVIDHTSVKLGEIAINALEPRNIESQETQPPFACNVIANFRGSYYLWGNRTAAKLSEKAAGGDLTAKHFLNIRQLSTTIKKQLYVACRRFTFDPNSDTLWFNFVNAITPTLEAMKADQGIRDYKVVKVYTDKKATIMAKVRIIPIEAVEDFDITVSLEDSFGGVSVTAEG